MKGITIAVSLSIAMCGCGTTSGRVGDLPEISDKSSAAKVVTIRVSSVIGAANGYTVAVDGKDLYGIGSGEYAEFLLPKGDHYIAVKCFGGWSPTWKDESLKFSATPSEVSYFRVSSSLKCADIKPIAEADALELTKGRTPISLDKLISK